MEFWRKYSMTRKMKDSGIEWIGEIPEDWEVRRLKGLGTIKGRIGFKGYTVNDLVDENTIGCAIVLGGTNIMKGGYINYDKLTYISEFKYLESPEIMLHGGEVLITKVGAGTGDNAIYDYYKERVTINPNIMIFEPKNRHLGKYINYFLLSEYVKRDINLESDKSGAQPAINQAYIKNLRILLPRIEIANKITNYLDTKCSKIDETIQKEKQVIEKLKQYKQAIITEAVTKGLDPDVKMKDSGIEWIGEVPEGWSVKRLRYIGRCQNGISKSSEAFGSGFPFVSYGDVYRNIELPNTVEGLVESSETDRKVYSVEKGDVFFTRTSETIEEIGLVCVCKNTIENATFAGFLIRVRPFDSQIDVNYSKYYFSSNIHRKFFVKEMNLVTRASLSQELLKRLPVLLPNLEEQKQIADYLDKKCASIDKAILNKEKLIEKLTEYKKSLIYECVTGKREV